MGRTLQMVEEEGLVVAMVVAEAGVFMAAAVAQGVAPAAAVLLGRARLLSHPALVPSPAQWALVPQPWMVLLW